MSQLTEAVAAYLSIAEGTSKPSQRAAALVALRKAFDARGKVYGSDDVLRVAVAAMQGILSTKEGAERNAKDVAADAERYARALLDGLEDGLD